MTYKKILIGLTTVFALSFVSSNSECQTTTEEYRRMRIAREAEDARRREMQKEQERERLRKAATTGEKTTPVTATSTTPTKPGTSSSDGWNHYLFDEVSTVINSNGLRRVRVENKFGYINAARKIVIPLLYAEAQEQIPGELVMLQWGSKWGYLDPNGKAIIDFEYEKAEDMMQGFAIVQKNGRSGVISEKGKMMVPPGYDEIERLGYGNVRLKLNNKYGAASCYPVYSSLLEPIYDEVTAQSSLVLIMRLNDLYGFQYFLSKASACKYGIINGFHNGYAIVSKNNKKGMVSSEGKDILPMKYDDVMLPDDSMIAVKLAGKWGFADMKGKLVIPSQYDKVGTVFYKGTAMETKAKLEFFINKKGQKINSKPGEKPVSRVPADVYFESAGPTVDGMQAVKWKGKWGFIDKDRLLLIPFIYDDYSYVFDPGEGLIAISYEGKYGYINLAGETVIPFQYLHAFQFKNGYASVKLSKEVRKWGLIDKTGKMIVPPKFDYPMTHHNGLIAVGINDKYGFYDSLGRQVTELIYESYGISKGKLFGVLDGKTVYIINKPMTDPAKLD